MGSKRCRVVCVSYFVAGPDVIINTAFLRDHPVDHPERSRISNKFLRAQRNSKLTRLHGRAKK